MGIPGMSMSIAASPLFVFDLHLPRLPDLTALLLGVVAGFIASSPIVAGLVAAVTIAILVRL